MNIIKIQNFRFKNQFNFHSFIFICEQKTNFCIIEGYFFLKEPYAQALLFIQKMNAQIRIWLYSIKKKLNMCIVSILGMLSAEGSWVRWCFLCNKLYQYACKIHFVSTCIEIFVCFSQSTTEPPMRVWAHCTV